MTEQILNIETFSDADFTVSRETDVHVSTNLLKMHVRTRAEDETVWIEASTENGMLVVTPAAGNNWNIALTIPEAKLLNLPVGSYVHSCIMESLSGSMRTPIWRGTLTHVAGPTRWNSNQ